jgi:hypothetical protein
MMPAVAQAFGHRSALCSALSHGVQSAQFQSIWQSFRRVRCSRELACKDSDHVKPTMREHVELGTNIQTDEATLYHFVHHEFPAPAVVAHEVKEYSPYEDGRHITTNIVEGFFGLVRRSVFGTYHHWGRGYLQHSLNELVFRYNNRKVGDSERTMLALRATERKRLTLREPRGASSQIQAECISNRDFGAIFKAA